MASALAQPVRASSRSLFLAAVWVAVLLMAPALSVSVRAQSSATTTIASTTVAGTNLTVNGTALGPSVPTVSLGAVTLTGITVSADLTTLTAPMPSLAPGTYSLRLSWPVAATCPATAPATDWVCVPGGGWVPKNHPLAASAQTTAFTLTGVVAVATQAIQISDGNNNVLGRFAGLYDDRGAFVYKDGYFARVFLSGAFRSAYLLWTGPNCTGTPFLAGGLPGVMSGTHVIQYSGITNGFYVVSGPGVAAPALSQVAILSKESPGGDVSPENGWPTSESDGSAYCRPNVGNFDAWALTPIDLGAALGWTVTGWPAHVPGPIRFQ
jgi:hypothetical protein